MKAGEYVRTKLGPNCDEITIRKIIEADENYYILDDFVDFGYGDSTNHIGKEDILKSSPNIIDLIEVGDYVNGMPVLHKENDELICGLLLKYKEENINSIVTREQFESMEYRL